MSHIDFGKMTTAASRRGFDAMSSQPEAMQQKGSFVMSRKGGVYDDDHLVSHEDVIRERDAENEQMEEMYTFEEEHSTKIIQRAARKFLALIRNKQGDYRPVSSPSAMKRTQSGVGRLEVFNDMAFGAFAETQELDFDPHESESEDELHKQTSTTHQRRGSGHHPTFLPEDVEGHDTEHHEPPLQRQMSRRTSIQIPGCGGKTVEVIDVEDGQTLTTYEEECAAILIQRAVRESFAKKQTA